jgi:hypothetical protein
MSERPSACPPVGDRSLSIHAAMSGRCYYPGLPLGLAVISQLRHRHVKGISSACCPFAPNLRWQRYHQ